MNKSQPFMPNVFEGVGDLTLSGAPLAIEGNAMLKCALADALAEEVCDVQLRLLYLVRQMNRCFGNAFLDMERQVTDICLQTHGDRRPQRKDKNDRTLNTDAMMNMDDFFSDKTRMAVIFNLTGVNNLGCLQQNCLFQQTMRAEEQAAEAAQKKADVPRCDVDVPSGREDIVEELMAIFNGNRGDAAEFVRAVDGARPTAITRKVNQLQQEGKILRSMSKRPLWTVLHRHGIYKHSESNWNSQVN